jgi:type IV pilus assembly protein PilM
MTATGNETPRQNMLKADLDAPPSGEGYIVTVHGMHWHDDPKDPQGSDVLYLRKTLLANLHKPVLERSGFKRDIGKMGISHATIVDFRGQDELVLKPGARKVEKGGRIDLSTAARPSGVGNPLGAGYAPGSEAQPGYQNLSAGAYPEGDAAALIANQFSGTGAGGPPTTIVVQPGQAPPAGLELENYDELHKTVFQIQFIYRDKPVENAAPAESTDSAAPTG